MLDAREVAALAHLRLDSVERWARTERIPAVKVDGVWFFDAAEVEAYLAGGRSKPRPQGPRVPAGPLLRQIELAGGDAALGVHKGSLDRAALDSARRQGTLPLWTADRLAVTLLGLTAWELWGDTVLEPQAVAS